MWPLCNQLLVKHKDCVPHRRKVRSPKHAPKQTLSKRKIAETDIAEIEIIDMKIAEIEIIDMKIAEIEIAEFLSMIFLIGELSLSVIFLFVPFWVYC